MNTITFSLRELEAIEACELGTLIYFESRDDEDGQWTHYDVVMIHGHRFYRYQGKIHQDAFGFDGVDFVEVKPVQKTVTFWERVEGDASCKVCGGGGYVTEHDAVTAADCPACNSGPGDES